MAETSLGLFILMVALPLLACVFWKEHGPGARLVITGLLWAAYWSGVALTVT